MRPPSGAGSGEMTVCTGLAGGSRRAHTAYMESATETRRGTLADHESLRVLCREVLERAVRTEAGDVPARLELLERLQSLVFAVRLNIDKENLTLRSLLAVTDAWGPERIVRLDAAHEHQDGAISAVEFDAASTIEGPALVTITRNFVRELVRELRWEARDLLGAELLRDDLVSIEQGG